MNSYSSMWTEEESCMKEEWCFESAVTAPFSDEMDVMRSFSSSLNSARSFWRIASAFRRAASFFATSCRQKLISVHQIPNHFSTTQFSGRKIHPYPQNIPHCTF